MQLRARTEAAHPAIDCLYPLLSAAAAFERALLRAPAGADEAWSSSVSHLVGMLLLAVLGLHNNSDGLGLICSRLTALCMCTLGAALSCFNICCGRASRQSHHDVCELHLSVCSTCVTLSPTQED